MFGVRLLAMPWYFVATIVVALDQASKLAAEHYLAYLQPVPVLPFLSLTLSYNPGAAFSFLGDASGWQRWLFTGFALVVSVVLIVWLRRLPARERWMNWGLSLLLGGAIGNVIDRIVYGHVIDFIHVHYDRWHYPIFNVADSAITVGVVMILIHAFWLDKRAAPG